VLLVSAVYGHIETELNNEFAAADTNSDHLLSQDEFEAGLKNLGVKSQVIAEEMWSEATAGQQSPKSLTLPELQHILRTHLQQQNKLQESMAQRAAAGGPEQSAIEAASFQKNDDSLQFVLSGKSGCASPCDCSGGATTCTKCVKGAYFDTTQQYCVVCCSYRSTFTSSGCPGGTNTVNNAVCSPCPTKSSDCPAGKFYQPYCELTTETNGCVACTAITGCVSFGVTCTTASNSVCSVCVAGFFKSGTTCVACPSGCSTCPSGVCTSCASGFRLVTTQTGESICRPSGSVCGNRNDPFNLCENTADMMCVNNPASPTGYTCMLNPCHPTPCGPCGNCCPSLPCGVGMGGSKCCWDGDPLNNPHVYCADPNSVCSA